MKRNLLVLYLLLFSVGQMWGQTDITGGNGIIIFNENQTFTGNAFVKSDFYSGVFASAGSPQLNEGTDFTSELLLQDGGALPAEGAVAAGNYIIRFKGVLPNYTGVYDLPATINQAAIAGATFATISDKTFTGEGITLQPSDINGTFGTAPYTLKTTDYSIASYSGNTNPGSASVTLNGTGNFTGTKTVNFAITPANIANATFATITDKTFTGEAINLLPADINGTLDTYTLLTSDYSIASYSPNTNAGTVTATLNGAGNFTGTKTVNFTISPANITNATFATITDKKYTGAPIILQTSEISGTFGTKPYALQTSDYSIASYSANTNVGQASANLNGAGNFNGTKTVNFAIIPASLDTDVTVSVSDQPNTGEVMKPVPIVKLGNVTLQEGIDYSLSYPDTEPDAYIAQGTWNILITTMGTNITGGPKNITFEIAATPPPLPIITFGELGENIHAGNIGNHEDGTAYLTFTAPVGTKPEDLYARSGGVSYTIIPMGNGNFHIDVEDVTEGMKVDIGWADPSGNEKLTDNNVKVYSREGSLFVETTESSSLAVYMITGRQFTARTIQAGTTTIQLPKGIYIVKVGDKGHKIVVR